MMNLRWLNSRRTCRIVWASITFLSAIEIGTARANHGTVKWSASGTILVPAPASFASSELLAPCNPSSEYQGLDGYWIHLPEGADLHRALLTSADPKAVDLDVWFTTADCSHTGYDEMATYLTNDEHGRIPPEARWAIVVMPIGVDASFSLSIEGMPI